MHTKPKQSSQEGSRLESRQGKQPRLLCDQCQSEQDPKNRRKMPAFLVLHSTAEAAAGGPAKLEFKRESIPSLHLEQHPDISFKSRLSEGRTQERTPGRTSSRT